MAEPTLHDIERPEIDPQLGGGSPSVVYDNRNTLNLINQNARFKAENDWRKYNQFLNDYQDRLKNQQDIANIQVADSDRDYLKQQSVELFNDALSDPYKIYSPEFNSKLAGIRANAVSSKAARDFAEQNAQFIVMHPEFNTDENKAKIDDYLHKQTVQNGGRKMFTLDVPDVFDNVGYFDALKKSTGQTIDASFVSPDKQFYTERQDTKYQYKPFLELAKLGYDSNPKIQKRAKDMFDSLDPQTKSNFENPKEFWVNFASKHFGAYDDIIEQGKPNVQSNSNYLKKEELGLKWANYGLDKRKLDKEDTGDVVAADGILRELTDSLKNGTTITEIGDNGKPKEFIEISDPTLLKTFSSIDKDGKSTNAPDAVRYDPEKDQAYLMFFDKKGNGDFKFNKRGGKWITKKVPLEARTWANLTTARTYGGKDKGNVNELVQNVITKAGGLYNLAKTYSGDNKQEGAAPKMKNESSYYSSQNNVSSIDGDTVTYKDGTVWQIQGNKTVQIK